MAVVVVVVVVAVVVHMLDEGLTSIVTLPCSLKLAPVW